MKKFNWKEYIKSRPDLRKNWNSPIKARLHYVLFGHIEEKSPHKELKTNLVNNVPSLIRKYILNGIFNKTKKNSKVGIIITYHNNISNYTIPCLKSVLKYTPKPRLILAFDNESTEEDSKNISNLFKEEDIRFIRIDDQNENGGLTGTWNQAIDICIENNCEKIILLNYDTLADDSWKIFIENIFNDNACYGPVSNDPGWNNAGQKKTKSYSLKNKNSLKKGTLINGFCMGFTKNALISNKYDSKYYFNPNFPFGGNELEWETRFEKKGGKFLTVEGCFLYHHGCHGWKDRTVVLDRIIGKNRQKTLFLEIGVKDGYILRNIIAKTIIGIGSDFNKINKNYYSDKHSFTKHGNYFYEMASNDFFEKRILKDKKIDVAHIEGTFEYKQVLRDIKNCLDNLNEGGVIVVNGCNHNFNINPDNYKKSSDKNSNYDVWKAIVYLRSTRNDLNIFTLDVDSGLGIITKGKPDSLLSYSNEEIEMMDFDFFDKKRKELLNLKKWDNFLDFLKKRNK
ncbi:glycosyltransferase [Candidatus Woesearchaeota archaeon]|nr:glycosyltransferase [Candidatus Woesearchaeota archaeon]